VRRAGDLGKYFSEQAHQVFLYGLCGVAQTL
jgi:hypothetical protein